MSDIEIKTPSGGAASAPSKDQLPATVPAIAIREIVMFPHMALPLSVDREKSVAAIDMALQAGKLVFAVSQKHPRYDDPQQKELYRFGVLSEISQHLKMPDGTVKVFLQGLARAKAENLRFDPEKKCWLADLSYFSDKFERTPELIALMRKTLKAFESYIKLSRRFSTEAVALLAQMEDPSRLADTMAANLSLQTPDKQDLLETIDPAQRLEKLLKLISAESEILSIEENIHNKVRTQIEKSQKEYYLNEQMKAIQQELHQKDDYQKELDALKKQLKKAALSAAAREAAEKELSRLEKMAPFSPEAGVLRTYLDWILMLPWESYTKDTLDIKKARAVLDKDHFGLTKTKDRVLDYLAVCKLTNSIKGPILCFVGPPGVGKTSIARSIASAMDRRYVRLSLGGVRDEAEIRGHRRTYVASMPGRIIQSMAKAKSANPVFLLDEIDKMGTDWRGDPAAALLEVLDPEQNKEFYDHYLDIPFDISKVMFITTANTLDGIPYSLRDRMEIIEFHGYTHDEKCSIAEGFLLPRQMKEHGLKEGSLKVDRAAFERTIRQYAREAGVRSLEREVASICRRAARKFVEAGKPVHVTAENLPEFLGIPKFPDEHPEHNAVGVATGLAWTEHGGEVLSVEAAALKGKGQLAMTGKLGEVMKESVQAALACVRSCGYAGRKDLSKTDLHIHLPEGAVPKDGPSAGITIATAIASLLTGKQVKKSLAMTGELTLTGRVLAIGGLKEKLLAAHREGIKTVLFPETNLKDLEDVPEKVRADLKLIPVSRLEQVLKLALDK
ncbi:MAG: endopeptidase La [Elusimicrobia bacterium]|nr:endopeptidase La [Elusimicrobiota bacterium]